MKELSSASSSIRPPSQSERTNVAISGQFHIKWRMNGPMSGQTVVLAALEPKQEKENGR